MKARTKRLKPTNKNADENIERAFARLAKEKFTAKGGDRGKAWRIAEAERRIALGEDDPFAQ